MEPSHMKSQGVDNWLNHWPKLQNHKKRPLILRDPSEAEKEDSTKPRNPAKTTGTRKGKEKARNTPETSADEQSDGENSGNNEENVDMNPDKDSIGHSTQGDPRVESVDSNVGVDEPEPFPAPSSVALSKETHWKFLTLLSNDGKYCQLICLLNGAQVSEYHK
jgi:hypothetical protein